MLKLSVFTVMLPDLTPEDAAQALARYGYAGVEWRVTHVPLEKRNESPSFWGNNHCTFELDLDAAARAKAAAEAAGLAVAGLGTYIAVGDLESVETAMRFAKICGAPQIRVGSGQLEDGMSYAACFERTRTFLAGVQDLSRQYDVKGLIEIHHNTLTPSASLAHRLVSHFDPDRIGVIYDVGNMVFEGFENYRLGLELLGPYLAHIHVKNACYERSAEGGVWQEQWAPLENGIVNWEDLFMALRSVGYSGWLGLENFSETRSTHETLAHDSRFLQDLIEEIYT